MQLQGMYKNSSQSLLIHRIIALLPKSQRIYRHFYFNNFIQVKICMYNECGTDHQKELRRRRRILKFINEIYIFGEGLVAPHNNNFDCCNRSTSRPWDISDTTPENNHADPINDLRESYRLTVLQVIAN